jgi:AcrR family transcriptional regulator
VASIRNTDSQDRILDAARDCVLGYGVRRTTLTDVARRAGVSRMTVYRHYPDATALVFDLMTREFSALLAEIDAEIDAEVGAAGPARERLVRRILLGVRRLRAHPLWTKVVDVDPELLLTFVIDRFGGTQQAVLAEYRSLVDEGHRDGSIGTGDPTAQAYALLVTTQSFVLSAGIAERDGVDLDGELERLLDGYLKEAS